MGSVATRQARRISTYIASLALLGSMFQAASSAGLGAGWQAIYQDNRIFPVGWNPFRNMSETLILISITLSVYLMSIRLSDKMPIRLLGVFSMIFLMLQSRILIVSNLSALPGFITEYSNLLSIISYLGCIYLIVSLVLLAMNVALIWLTYRYPST